MHDRTDDVRLGGRGGRRALGAEAALLVALALGVSSLRSAVALVAALTAPVAVRDQAAVLNGSAAPGRPWVDLAYQLVFVVSLALPPLLAVTLVLRGGGRLGDLGLRAARWRREAAAGVAVAAVVGGLGLALYLGSRALGTSLHVVPTTLPPVWWRVPVLVLSACGNAALEEVLMAYLLARLGQLGWGARRAVGLAALVRGSYHLYQGAAGFAGNLVMGLAFGWLFTRYRTVVPQLVAHAVIDVTAFVGFVYLGRALGLA